MQKCTITVGHVFGDWTVIKQPTTTEKGEKQRICSQCGYKEIKEVPVLKGDEKPVVNESANVAKTGDGANILLWGVVLVFAVLGIVLAAMKKRAK